MCLYLSVQGGTNTPDIRWKLKRMRAVDILPHVKDVICYDWIGFLGSSGFSSSNRQRYVKRIYFVHASSFPKMEKYCKIVETGDRIPVKRRKEEPPLVFYLFGGPLPHPHKSPYSCLRGSRGREDANTSYLTSSRQSRPSPPSLPLPPRGGTGRSSRLCGRQLQPQGYVISVHHSQQRSSLSSGGTQKHDRLG